MSHPTDSTFDFLARLGVLRQEDVQTAGRLLQALESATAGMHGNHEVQARDNGIAAAGENEDRVKLPGKSVPFTGNSSITTGHDWSMLSEGWVQTIVLLVAAVAEFNRHLEDYDVDLSKANMNGGEIKNINAITAVLAHLQLAHLVARGAFSEQISLTEDRVSHEMDSIGRIKQDKDNETVFQHNVSAGGEDLPNPHMQNQVGTSRPGGAPGEINHVPFATDGLAEEILEIQRGKTSQLPGGFVAIVDPVQQQKTGTIAQILDYTLPLQHAFDRLDQRVAQVEAQLHQTPYNGS